MEEESSPTFQINKSSKSSSSQPSERTRQRYRMRDKDHQSMRYECVCTLHSLFQHIKKHHPQFLEKNRYFAANNIIETVDAKYGFKIKKVLQEKIEFKSQEELKREHSRGVQLQNLRLKQQGEIQHLKTEYSSKNELAMQKLNEINYENSELDRRVSLARQKIEKIKEIKLHMKEVIASYEHITTILKIKQAAQQLGDDELCDEEYFP